MLVTHKLIETVKKLNAQAEQSRHEGISLLPALALDNLQLDAFLVYPAVTRWAPIREQEEGQHAACCRERLHLCQHGSSQDVVVCADAIYAEYRCRRRSISQETDDVGDAIGAKPDGGAVAPALADEFVAASSSTR